MLETLLASQSKTNLLTFFLANPERAFFAGELKQRIGGKNLNADLSSLAKVGVLHSFAKKGKRYYRVNNRHPLHRDLANMVKRNAKNIKQYEDELYHFLKKLKGLRYAALSGLFVGKPELECDILLVGDLSARQLAKFEQGCEKLVGQEVNYAIMGFEEFNYRRDSFDRFIKDIFENEHLTVINKIRA